LADAIETRRLRLLPVAAGDVDAICVLLRLPEVRRHLGDGEHLSTATVTGWIADSLTPSSVARYWRIGTADSPTAGLIGLRPPATPTLALRAIGWRSLELVVALAPSHRGRGFAAEAVEAVVAEGLADGVTFAIIGAVDAPNESAHGLMARCGFAELGRIDGPSRTLIVYERSL
jgi:RimJ/RimL family protein N-acetyltransferase